MNKKGQDYSRIFGGILLLIGVVMFFIAFFLIYNGVKSNNQDLNVIGVVLLMVSFVADGFGTKLIRS